MRADLEGPEAPRAGGTGVNLRQGEQVAGRSHSGRVVGAVDGAGAERENGCGLLLLPAQALGADEGSQARQGGGEKGWGQSRYQLPLAAPRPRHPRPGLGLRPVPAPAVLGPQQHQYYPAIFGSAAR